MTEAAIPLAKEAPIVATIDGRVECGGVGINQATVYLDSNNNGPDEADFWTETKADGTFELTYPGGDTIVRQVVPNGFQQLTPAKGLGIHASVAAGARATVADFVNAVADAPSPEPVPPAPPVTVPKPPTPAPPIPNPIPTQTAGIQGLPTFFVDTSGDDSNDGKTPATAWKTPKVVSGSNVIVSPQTFILSSPISFAGIKNAWIGAADPNKPATLSGSTVTKWDPTSNNCTLANVTVTSPDGKGVGGNVHGNNLTILNVNLGNLAEGFDYQTITNLTITGGKQTGNTQGRCHYLIDVHNLQWTGGAFGPAQTQSPVRFSPPGVVGGLVKNVAVTQRGSGFPIACWAIHCASGVTFDGCTSDAADFSFGSAGDGGVGAGTPDRVEKCIITNLKLTDAKLEILNVAFNNQYISPNLTNQTGECVSVSCLPGSGNTLVGAQMHSPKHGIHFYSVSDLKVSNCTLFSTNKAAPVIDGAFVAANDAGGNKLSVTA